MLLSNVKELIVIMHKTQKYDKIFLYYFCDKAKKSVPKPFWLMAVLSQLYKCEVKKNDRKDVISVVLSLQKDYNYYSKIFLFQVTTSKNKP